MQVFQVRQDFLHIILAEAGKLEGVGVRKEHGRRENGRMSGADCSRACNDARLDAMKEALKVRGDANGGANGGANEAAGTAAIFLRKTTVGWRWQTAGGDAWN